MEFFLIFVGSYLLSAGVMPCAIVLLRKYKMLDFPGPRKIHSQPVATAGGLGIALSFYLVLWFLWWMDFLDVRKLTGPLTGITLGGLLLLGVGLYDDLRGSRPLVKLAFQVLAALILYDQGIRIVSLTNPLSNYIPLSHFDLPVTVFWLVLVMNAVNLIDGLDGLASGIVFISAYTLFLIQIIVGEAVVMSVILVNLILAGVLLGFIRHNFFPARVFLGDTGSMFLGMLIGASSILQSTKGAATITLMVPLITLMVPICDTGMAFLRRVGRGKNPFLADQQHIHHRMLNLGWTPKQVVLIMYLLCIYLSFVSFVTMLLPKQVVFLLTGVIALGFFVAFELMGITRKNHEAP